jgi:hypothetical protein
MLIRRVNEGGIGGVGHLSDSVNPSKFMKKTLLRLALFRLVENLYRFGGTYSLKVQRRKVNVNVVGSSESW